MKIRISEHALERFRERVRSCTREEAYDEIMSHSRALESAIAIGARVVKLGNGARLLINEGVIVTVLASRMTNRKNLGARAIV